MAEDFQPLPTPDRGGRRGRMVAPWDGCRSVGRMVEMGPSGPAAAGRALGSRLAGRVRLGRWTTPRSLLGRWATPGRVAIPGRLAVISVRGR